jgi:trehalose utilization protein
MIDVTIYNEFVHELQDEAVKAVYPEGIHIAIKSFLEKDQAIGKIRCAVLQDHRETLSKEVLDGTDVLIWWGHMRHHEVDDEVAARVCRRVLDGMGLVVLHSGHASKPFKALMGTDTDQLRWRAAGEKVRLWNIARNHPITRGLTETFVIPNDETYGEPFGIPNPDELIFLSWFQGGEVFRSGCTWRRGEGKIFYFQNGHETHPVYYQKEVQLVITNAVKWAYPVERCCIIDRGGPNTPALEKY